MKVAYTFYIFKHPSSEISYLYIHASINKKRIRFSTGVPVEQSKWSGAKNEAKMTDPAYLQKNKIIDAIKQKISQIKYDCISQNRSISPQRFKELVLGEAQGLNFIEYCEKKLKSKNATLKPQTLKAYNSSLVKLREYKPQVYFSDIDFEFITNYQNYLISEKRNNPNTASKALIFIKTFFNEALNEETYRGRNPFAKFKIKRIDGRREYLNQDELLKLEKLYREGELNRGEKIVLRSFLFCCYTGLRYGDLEKLTSNDIYQGKHYKFLRIVPEKTDKLIRQPLDIPVIKKAEKLIAGELFPGQKIMNVYTNQVSNRYLKDIMRAAEINKKISFHCGRHTFATLSGVFGIPVEVVKTLLGHTDIKTTLLYRKISEDEISKELKKWEK